MFFIPKTLFSFFVPLSCCLSVFTVLIRRILWEIAVSSAYRADIPMTIERQIWSFGKNYFELWKVNTLKTKWCILHSNWIIFSHMRWILLHIYHAYLHDICLYCCCCYISICHLAKFMRNGRDSLAASF